MILTLPLLFGVQALRGTDSLATPVTANPSPEAVKLLRYLYSISGNHTLAGRHCVPLVGSTRLAGVQKLTQHYPAVFGQDFGFSEPGTWDGINYRQQPRWTWFMVRGEGGGFQGFQAFRAVYQSEQTLTLDKLPRVTVTQPRIHYPILK